MSPTPETAFQQVSSPILATATVSTSPVPTHQATMAAASLYQGRPIGPTAPYTLTNGAAAAAAAATLHTDLGYAIATSQPSYIVAPSAKLTTPTHPQSKPSFDSSFNNYEIRSIFYPSDSITTLTV